VKSKNVIIELTAYIEAPVEKVFDLARSIDLHTDSMAHTGEQAVAGRTSGLIEMGETVTWRARHFGKWQTLTSKITEYNYPNYFTDEMVEGAFKSFSHQHLFYAINKQTVMMDIFIFESPRGKLGELANFLFLGRYMTNLLKKRNKAIKKAAEAS
jgi:ligand-binding SRPBCC domain-containing protein